MDDLHDEVLRVLLKEDQVAEEVYLLQEVLLLNLTQDPLVVLLADSGEDTIFKASDRGCSERVVYQGKFSKLLPNSQGDESNEPLWSN